jgi:Ala-tRNA(Pro) deacylase
MIPEAIELYLKENGVDFEVMEHPRASTAQETAETAGVSGWKVVKCVAVRVDGIPVVCALPAPMVVDLDAVCDALEGEDCELCVESELASLFPGCEVGAAPPLGTFFQMRTVCDRSLAGAGILYLPGGNHREVISLDAEDYERLEHPVLASIARMPGEAWQHAEHLDPEPHSWHP